MPEKNIHPTLVLLLALTLCNLPATAADDRTKSDTPADYAYALPLQISGKQGVVGLRLPLPVYQQARTAALDDLRVFDAHGNPQPFALYHPQPATPAQRSTLAANIFPIRAQRNTAAGPATFDLDIRTRADGSVLSVQARTGKGAGGGALSSLLLDFGADAIGTGTVTDTASPMRIEALRFTLPPAQTEYTAEVWLETSADLKRWDTVGAAELRWLRNDNAQTLASDRLEFSPQSFRYARLTWRRGEPLLFAGIQAETIIRKTAEPPRETLWIQPVRARQAGDLAYPAGIAIPVEQIALRFSEPNIVYPVALGQYVERPSRHSGNPTEWLFEARTRATFYQITQNEQTRRSGAIQAGDAHAQEWVIRPQTNGAGAMPELGLSWQPATLVFLAGGTPPYTLSFGRSDAVNAAQPLNQVAPNFSAQELGQLELAQVGALQSSAGNAQANSAAAQAGISARNRSLMLWGVLLLGVLVLGGMVWRLVKQMRSAPPAGGA